MKSSEDLVIYFTRYHLDKSITMLNLYFDEIIGKIGECEGKKYLIVDDFTLDRTLDKIKRKDIEKLDDTKILIDTDDKLPDDITLKNAVILMTCVIKDGNKFYPQLFFKKELHDK